MPTLKGIICFYLVTVLILHFIQLIQIISKLDQILENFEPFAQKEKGIDGEKNNNKVPRRVIN